ncbi:molybdopterin-dependent oxidoreductase [Actinoallomurus bryophytorum]|uniref:molybdopterin-dependent oxidoreductase n=1 Tax=Actinoallomurus bryophytorum TaxID=1490222 RepID=UPI001FE78E2D|nr:molybdopterin-dependent oxidoreductase [Actinoallomurus bryophytorum]
MARKRLVPGLIGFMAFGALGAVSAVTRPANDWITAVPSIAGGLAGMAALTLLVRAMARAGLATAPARRTKASPETDPRVPDETPAPDVAKVPSGAGEVKVPSRAVVSSGGGEPSDEIANRDEPKGPSGTGRRSLLLTGAGAVAVAGASGLGGRLLLARDNVGAARKNVRLPRPVSTAKAVPNGAQIRVPGMTPFVTPNPDFYRVDTALTLPQVSPHDWMLRIHGMVDHPVELSFDDLLRQPMLERDITLSCVSNQVGGRYAGNARWLGASLPALLRSAGVRSGADQVLSRSTDGFTISTPIQTIMDGRDSLLAVGMNGEALPVAHGFPARMIVPGLYGYVSATKWVVDLKVTRFSTDRAYWTKRGYSEQAPIKTLSRIDVPRSFAQVKAGRVPIAGTAWAQHRGIDVVEVRVDNGPWRRAELAPVPGIDTWRQWVLEWDAAPGSHRLEVRATDGTGTVQPQKRVPIIPNGATGWHSVVVTVT